MQLPEKPNAAGIIAELMNGADPANVIHADFGDPDEALRRLEAQDIAQRSRHLEDSEIPLSPQDIHRIAHRKYDPTRATVAVAAFLEHATPRVLFLSGDYGTGKTFGAATGAAVSGARFVRAQHLPQTLNPGYRETPPNLRTSALWVVDDLGTEDHSNARWRAAFFEFVDARQFYGKTIITTNLTPAELRLRYDARVSDRLRSCARIVTVAGKSMREDIGGGL